VDSTAAFIGEKKDSALSFVPLTYRQEIQRKTQNCISIIYLYFILD